LQHDTKAISMARKVILDVDPGIDDAVAMCLALFDPRLDVVAVTAVAGNVPAEQATRNVQAIIEQLDPPRWPRIGVAAEPEHSPAVDARYIHGADGLGNANFQVAELHHQHPSEKVICDEIRAAPEEISILALGPLTNIARVLQRDPGIAVMMGQLIISGGTVTAPGNITPAAEFNIHCDPLAAQMVFRSLTTKTLVPLDVSNQVTLGYDLLDLLPDESTSAGRFLRRTVPYVFRSYRQNLGLESIHLHDAVALIAATHPELFEVEEMAGDVETAGQITLGATVFDRRSVIEWRTNMEVATQIDAVAARDYIIRGLQLAGKQS
jgi:purine nucleosidase